MVMHATVISATSSAMAGAALVTVTPPYHASSATIGLTEPAACAQIFRPGAESTILEVRGGVPQDDMQPSAVLSIAATSSSVMSRSWGFFTTSATSSSFAKSSSLSIRRLSGFLIITATLGFGI